MPRSTTFSIAPEDKRSVAVTLKLTDRENDLLTRYAAQLDSDKSYVAGKIFEAVIPQALHPEAIALANGSGKAAQTPKRPKAEADKPGVSATAKELLSC